MTIHPTQTEGTIISCAFFAGLEDYVCLFGRVRVNMSYIRIDLEALVIEVCRARVAESRSAWASLAAMVWF